MRSDHNMSVLKTQGVDHLDFSELTVLLLQNDPQLLPEVSVRRAWASARDGERPGVGRQGNILAEERPGTPLIPGCCLQGDLGGSGHSASTQGPGPKPWVQCVFPARTSALRLVLLLSGDQLGASCISHSVPTVA